MLNIVFYDLRVFILTQAILIGIFSQINAVLGYANPNVEGNFMKHHLKII